MSRNRGFTLIELLVVIAIIAILAAILFPVFSKARENARKATCQSNLRQIANAVLMYAQDYDEFLPRTYTAAGQARYSFMQRIEPYTKTVGVFDCPNQPVKAIFAYNGERSYPFIWYGYHMSAFQRPADTVMTLDFTPNVWLNAWKLYLPSTPASSNGGYRPDPLDGSQYPVWGATGRSDPTAYWRYFGFCTRHNGMGNVAFMDGHVKAYSYTTLFDNGKDTYFTP